MATPRKRYPSDKRRVKTRPHVKIHLSARSHPRYREVFDDLEGRAVIWGLWLLAVQYHAPQTNDEVTLGPSDLMWLSGRTHPHYAEKSVRTWAELMNYPTRKVGRSLIITIRNLQRKQGFNSALPGGATPTPPSPEVQKYRSTEVQNTPTESEGGQKGKDSDRSPPPSDGSQGLETLHPEAPQLAMELRQQLLAYVDHWTPPKTLNTWIRDFDRMLRLDGTPPGSIPVEAILKVIHWVARDDFEQKNVQSAAKLRKRFGSLYAKANGGSSPGGRVDKIAQAINESEERDRERAQRPEIEAGEAEGPGGPVLRLRSGG